MGLVLGLTGGVGLACSFWVGTCDFWLLGIWLVVVLRVVVLDLAGYRVSCGVDIIYCFAVFVLRLCCGVVGFGGAWLVVCGLGWCGVLVWMLFFWVVICGGVDVWLWVLIIVDFVLVVLGLAGL